MRRRYTVPIFLAGLMLLTRVSNSIINHKMARDYLLKRIIQHQITSSLLLTSAREGNFDAVAKFIQQGAPINCFNKIGTTPLMFAAINNQTNMAQLLLIKGANPNAQDNIGNTALHYAIYNNHIETVDLLMRYQADTLIKNRNQQTPQDLLLTNKINN